MQSAISSGIENIACERDRGCALAAKPPVTICDPFRIKEAKGRDTAHLQREGTQHICGGPLLIGCFRSRRFLKSWKPRPEFEKHVPNQRKEVKDKLTWRSTYQALG